MLCSTERNELVNMECQRVGRAWKYRRCAAEISEFSGFCNEDGLKPTIPRWRSLANSDQIKDLPTKDGRGIPLKNVLSITTAGSNRYLFHFESFHSLAQWTAAI